MTQPETGPTPARPTAFGPAAFQVVPPMTFEDLRVGETFRAPGRTRTDARAATLRNQRGDLVPSGLRRRSGEAA